MITSFKRLITETNELVPLFALGRIVHPVLVEMFGLAGGYRGFWFDQEHASISTEQISALALAARANDMDTFVRMPPIGYWQVTQALEAGAGGVMAAQISSADEAREFVSWTKFSPQGVRGLNSSGYDAKYSHKPLGQFATDANREGFVAIQIETTQAVEQAEQIAALDGVDLLFVGPADLSLALGVPGQFHAEKVWEAIAHVSRACRNHGISWGAVVPDPSFAERAVELGCRMPTVGNEIHALRMGIESLRTKFDKAF